MKTNKERRSFLGKLGLGIGSVAALPVFSFSRNIREAIHLAKTSPANPIKSMKPLGFQWDTADPFLFCVHHEDQFPKGNERMGPADSMKGRSLGDDFIIKDGYRMYHGKTVPGFPGHPHRGFETITIVRDGVVDHADSLGAAGRYGYGDVQWMTAGKGVQHSEMFPLVHREKENPMELFQIWLNLPAKNKMVDPHFTMLWSESIPKYEHTNANGAMTRVEVIAGRIGMHEAPAPPPDSWAADPKNEVAIYNIKMDPGASWELPAASRHVNRYLYYYVGEKLRIGGQIIPGYHGVQVDASAKLRLEAGDSKARILMLQGAPIGEQVMQYGPFVMNTKEEIKQAFEDYHKTQFGGWPWPKKDQVHDRNSGRFALHADGRREEKS